jgi:serine/threonine-protein kinase RsbW
MSVVGEPGRLGEGDESSDALGALLSFCSAFRVDLLVPGDSALTRTVTDGVMQLLRGRPGVGGHEFEIELALHEALTNAVRHGCRCDRRKLIACRVSYERTSGVRILVRDPGSGFDVGSLANPLDEANLLRSNGRGIFLIRQLMDEVRFTRGGRVIEMRKGRAAFDQRPKRRRRM